MFFERIFLQEEYLGLISGISFVLMGVFAYFLYLLTVSYLILLFIIAAVAFSGLTSILFQIHRIKKIKPGLSTFLGGITLGISVLFWVLSSAVVNGDLIREVEVSGISAALTALSFFAFGFLFMAFYPVRRYSSKMHHKEMHEKSSKKEDIEDFIDRL